MSLRNQLLIDMRPEIFARLDIALNKSNNIDISNLSFRSEKRVWWRCHINSLHYWNAAVYSQTRPKSKGCPLCTGRLVVHGLNDLSVSRPDLYSELDFVKNKELGIDSHKLWGSLNKQVWWICAKDNRHRWFAQISDRSSAKYGSGRGQGCPFCAGQKTVHGINDLSVLRPDLYAQIDFDLNENESIEVTTLSHRTKTKVWWKCPKNNEHVWFAAVGNRTGNAQGCPLCAGQLTIHGINDLSALRPDIFNQLNFKKNQEDDIDISTLSLSNDKKVWWQCPRDKRHSWKGTVNSKTGVKNVQCPICVNQLVIKGLNDLSALMPKLYEELDFQKNEECGIDTNSLALSSKTKAWWKCIENPNHSWQAHVYSRSGGPKSGCPKCSVGATERNFREAFEKLAKFNFESHRIVLIRSSRKRDLAQIDMLNDELKLVIEYDGEWTHGADGPEGKTLERKLADDTETTQALVDIGYNVIRIRDHSRQDKLPIVPLDPEYDSSVFQITYKSFGKDRDIIEDLAQRIIDEKKNWFKI